eukprot:GHVU01037749.1.p1 GENE.GHVU01037749.1~~GHVU01037749.1.p1  ORF type:complete len:118 (-),score=8.74 GHVU01037749.1:242-595(-)
MITAARDMVEINEMMETGTGTAVVTRVVPSMVTDTGVKSVTMVTEPVALPSNKMTEASPGTKTVIEPHPRPDIVTMVTELASLPSNKMTEASPGTKTVIDPHPRPDIVSINIETKTN